MLLYENAPCLECKSPLRVHYRGFVTLECDNCGKIYVAKDKGLADRELEYIDYGYLPIRKDYRGERPTKAI